MIAMEGTAEADLGVDVLDVERGRGSSTIEAVRAALAMPRTIVGLVLLLPMALVALIGPWLAPHDPREFIDIPYVEPGAGRWLGTDAIGRDVLSRLLAGGRMTLLTALAATVLGVFLGTFLGLTAALARPWADAAIMRTLDLLLAFPQYVLVLLLSAMFGASTPLTILLVGLVWTTPVAKVMRAAAVGVAQQDFVRYSRSLGARRLRILGHGVLPNVTAPLSVEFGLGLTYSIAIVAGLSFLGFGPQPPTPDWGVMIAENQSGLRIQPLAALAPVACIAILAIGVNLVTEGLARGSAEGRASE